jgi:hypothetical protein
MAAALLALVAGVWIVAQATGGELAARILSWRGPAPGDPADLTRTGSPATAAALKSFAGTANAVAAGPVTAAGGNLSTWEGVTLDSTVIASFRDMVQAARSDGVELLPASGWRSSAEQIRLRRQNCGPTDYDIYRKPSGSCSPPTAIPGTSNHERGLAVDFSFGSNRNSPQFRWLTANAARFGWRNLPSEAWHWSRDGR